MHVIAAKAVAFGEALQPDFSDYSKNVIDNAHALAETLKDGGLNVISGGTDTHVVLIDLQPKKVTGKAAEAAWDEQRSRAIRTAFRTILRHRLSPQVFD